MLGRRKEGLFGKSIFGNVRRRNKMWKCESHSELVEECAQAGPDVSTGST